MLRGSIQALEVQRATISTLRAFAQSVGQPYPGQPAAEGGAAAAPSPLEVVLGLRPGPAAATPAAAAAPAGNAPADSGQAAPPQGSPAGTPASDSTPVYGMPAANAWWSMLQDQFNLIAHAASSLPGADAAQSPAASARANPRQASTGAPASSAPRKRAPARKTATPRSPRGKT